MCCLASLGWKVLQECKIYICFLSGINHHVPDLHVEKMWPHSAFLSASDWQMHQRSAGTFLAARVTKPQGPVREKRWIYCWKSHAFLPFYCLLFNSSFPTLESCAPPPPPINYLREAFAFHGKKAIPCHPSCTTLINLMLGKQQAK